MTGEMMQQLLRSGEDDEEEDNATGDDDDDSADNDDHDTSDEDDDADYDGEGKSNGDAGTHVKTAGPGDNQTANADEASAEAGAAAATDLASKRQSTRTSAVRQAAKRAAQAMTKKPASDNDAISGNDDGSPTTEDGDTAARLIDEVDVEVMVQEEANPHEADAPPKRAKRSAEDKDAAEVTTIATEVTTIATGTETANGTGKAEAAGDDGRGWMASGEWT